MAEIVDLDRYRKSKKRAAKKKAAPRKRMAKARTKRRRAGDNATRERRETELDGKKLERRDED